MPTVFQKSLIDAVADTLGFVLGGLAGRYAGMALGFDFFSGASGWDTNAVVGLVFMLAGFGAGRILFRRLFAKWRNAP